MDGIDEGWRCRRRRYEGGRVAVAGLLRTIFARGCLRRGLRKGRLVVTGCCGLGHDLLCEGGFSELFPRVGSLIEKVSWIEAVGGEGE